MRALHADRPAAALYGRTTCNSPSGCSSAAHLLGVVVLVAVRAEPGAGGHLRAHGLQGRAVAHQQARAAEAPCRRAAPRALRLACIM